MIEQSAENDAEDLAVALEMLEVRRGQVERLVSALKTIGMHPHFIDAILAGPGAAPATEERS